MNGINDGNEPQSSHLVKVTGTIVRRRCLGKHLAFADVDLSSCSSPITQHDGDEEGQQTRKDKNDIIKVAFRRSSPSWNTQDDNNLFPTKNALLPHGATVAMILCHNHSIMAEHNRDNGEEKNSSTAYLEVSSWKILTHPHDIAVKYARSKLLSETESSTSGGIPYSDYMKSRTEHFYQYSANRHKCPKKENINKTVTKEPLLNSSYEDNHGEVNHSSNSKGLRSKVFASWIVQTFGCDLLREGKGVLDIAGGRGALSIELAVAGQIACTIIDPMVRSSLFKKKEMKRLKKANSSVPIYIAERFILDKNNNKISDDVIANMEEYSCYIGLHADEPTEDILDAALHYNKSVAIVPCCVFPSFFPFRRLRSQNNKFVNTYEDFLCYLLEKDDRLCRATLDFEGKNQVIYLKQC